MRDSGFRGFGDWVSGLRLSGVLWLTVVVRGLKGFDVAGCCCKLLGSRVQGVWVSRCCGLTLPVGGVEVSSFGVAGF